MAAFEILGFLQYYHQYPCLWDKSHPDYKNRKDRDDAESALLEISGLWTIKSLRSKIRSIRGTYNNELRKIKKSTSICVDGDAVYKPKLHWFPYAHSFLYKNFDSESNLIPELENEAQEMEENEEAGNRMIIAKNITITSSCLQSSKPSDTRCSALSVKTGVGKNLSRPWRKTRLLKNYRKHDTLKEAINNQVVSPNYSSDDEFMVFGQSVGIQLSKLPLHKAIQIQHDIQSLLTNARLGELISCSSSSASPSTDSILSSSHSYISNSAVVYEETQDKEELQGEN